MKAYTDLEQSKKLSEILPLESADMRYTPFGDTHPWVWGGSLIEHDSTPCWSLAALLEQLPFCIGTFELEINKDDGQYQLVYNDRWGREDDIETKPYDNFVDAAFEMICQLKENKKL